MLSKGELNQLCGYAQPVSSEVDIKDVANDFDFGDGAITTVVLTTTSYSSMNISQIYYFYIENEFNHIPVTIQLLDFYDCMAFSPHGLADWLHGDPNRQSFVNDDWTHARGTRVPISSPYVEASLLHMSHAMGPNNNKATSRWHDIIMHGTISSVVYDGFSAIEDIRMVIIIGQSPMVAVHRKVKLQI